MAYMRDSSGRRLDAIGAADTRKGIYVPAGWGEFIRPKLALAKTGAGLATIACFGDSIMGYFTSNLKTKTTPARVQQKLRDAGYPDGGSGFFSVRNSRIHLSSIDAAYNSVMMSYTGTWTSSNVNDGPGNTGIQSSVDGSTATYTVRGSTVGIVFLRGSGSGGAANVASVTIDGGAPILISNNGSSAVIRQQLASGLSSGDHTVVVTKTGTTRFDLWGFYGENPSGVLVNNFSAYGSTTGNDTAASYVFGNPAAWSGGHLWPSDLFIYAKGANDANGTALAADTYVDNVRKVLEQVRNTGTATGNTDIILFLPYLGNFDPTRLGSAYSVRLRGLADHYGAALINGGPVYRNSQAYAVSSGYLGVTNGANPGASGSDSVHVSDQGADWNADLIMRVLGVTA